MTTESRFRLFLTRRFINGELAAADGEVIDRNGGSLVGLTLRPTWPRQFAAIASLIILFVTLVFTALAPLLGALSGGELLGMGEEMTPPEFLLYGVTSSAFPLLVQRAATEYGKRALVEELADLLDAVVGPRA